MNPGSRENGTAPISTAPERHSGPMWKSALLAAACFVFSLTGCASVEELVAEGDLARTHGNPGRAYELYWQAYHRDSDHPLVRARLPGAHQQRPLHESR